MDDAQRPAKMEETVKMAEKQEQKMVEKTPPDEGEEKDLNAPGRDPGVPDDLWEELQKAKKKEAEVEEKRKKEREIEEQ